MKNKLKNLHLISIEDLTIAKIVTGLLSLLFLYWGLFTNFIFPIWGILTEPNFANLILLIVKIFLLSGVCIMIGITLLVMTIFKKV